MDALPLGAIGAAPASAVMASGLPEPAFVTIVGTSATVVQLVPGEVLA